MGHFAFSFRMQKQGDFRDGYHNNLSIDSINLIHSYYQNSRRLDSSVAYISKQAINNPWLTTAAATVHVVQLELNAVGSDKIQIETVDGLTLLLGI